MDAARKYKKNKKKFIKIRQELARVISASCQCWKFLEISGKIREFDSRNLLGTLLKRTTVNRPKSIGGGDTSNTLQKSTATLPF